MVKKTLDPICIKCKRVMRKGDKRAVEGEHWVHAKGYCRGPHVKHWFVLGYRDDEPVYAGRLPDKTAELETLLNEIPDGVEIRLRKMNLGQLSRITERMMR